MSGMDLMTMPWQELRNWIRMWGPEIRQLSERGDKLANRVYNLVCEVAYENLPLTHPRHTDLRKALTEYLHRDLSVSDRTELGGKFGHLLEEEKGPGPVRIVVPGKVTRQ